MAATSSKWLRHHGSAPTSMAAPPHLHRPVLPSDFRPACLLDGLFWPPKVTPSGQHHRREQFPPLARQPRTMEGKTRRGCCWKTAGRPLGFLLPLLISHIILMFIMFMIYATCICMQEKKKKGKKITRAKEGIRRLSKEEKLR